MWLSPDGKAVRMNDVLMLIGGLAGSYHSNGPITQCRICAEEGTEAIRGQSIVWKCFYRWVRGQTVIPLWPNGKRMLQASMCCSCILSLKNDTRHSEGSHAPIDTSTQTHTTIKKRVQCFAVKLCCGSVNSCQHLLSSCQPDAGQRAAAATKSLWGLYTVYWV